MQPGIRGLAIGLVCMIGAPCVSCATGGGVTSDGSGSDDGSVADGTTLETSATADSSAGSDTSSSSPDSSDVSSLTIDSSADPSDGVATTESGPVDTGAPDVAFHDAATADAPGDAATCSAGPSPSYAQTCTNCSISATCLLSCESCRKKDQTLNLNPWVQLPCPGTTSVWNNDGVLVCS
jgi:hypothetical protein